MQILKAKRQINTLLLKKQQQTHAYRNFSYLMCFSVINPNRLHSTAIRFN